MALNLALSGLFRCSIWTPKADLAASAWYSCTVCWVPMMISTCITPCRAATAACTCSVASGDNVAPVWP